MQIFPSKKIELITKIPIKELSKILLNNIQPEQSAFNRPKIGSCKRFEGIFENNKFKIHQTVIGTNSFVPIIKGTIQEDLNGTKLIADFKIFLSVKIFINFWFVFLSLGIMLLIYGVLYQDLNPLVLIIPVFMNTVPILVCRYLYIKELKNSINVFKRIVSE